MSIHIRIYGSIAEAGSSRWDRLIDDCGAPVFYRSAFLDAFERFPLHDVQKQFYITGEDEHGALVFATPVYLLHGVDPMRLLRDHFPGYGDASILVNHVWHCYDTWLPATRLDPDVIEAALDAMSALAVDLDAALWGFTNVDGTGALSRALAAAGMLGVEVDQRFCADVTDVPDFDHFLAALRQSVRANLRRYMRIAQRSGVVTVVADVAHADLDGFVALARAGAAKYNNADYYRPGIFQNFVRALGAHARVWEQRLGEQLIGSVVLLVDDGTLHIWVAGSDYRTVPQISPFYLGFMAGVDEALTTRKTSVEAGRRNPHFKTRHGMQPRPVQAHFVPTSRRASDG